MDMRGILKVIQVLQESINLMSQKFDELTCENKQAPPEVLGLSKESAVFKREFNLRVKLLS